MAGEERDSFWMSHAIDLAAQAEALGEVPVGALVVKGDALISTGYNQSITCHDPSAHAEIVALRKAGEKLNNYRLPECELYVTLEPCAMCATAMVHARLKRVIFGALDPKTGSAGSLLNLVDYSAFNHQLHIKSGVLATECSTQLSQFFKKRREQHRLLKKFPHRLHLDGKKSD
ncbi:MAG: tRNA adenosine(34) deaminase TadA [Thiomicrospira sp.]|nr:tRNA adenosine(34) deaminase TadA [Thiomicrospira sp.]MBE0494246.1 tRNA adenosine(34) deaminase TadA [Thiomicrospira sp.]